MSTVSGHGSRRRKVAELSNLQFALLISTPVICFLVLVVAYPLGYSLWMSFQSISFFGGYTTEYVGLKNYSDVIADPVFWHGALVSIEFTALSVLLTVPLGLLIALALNRRMRGGGIIRAIAILPWAVSPYGVGVIFSLLGRGQTGLGTAVAAVFGSTETVNLITSNLVLPLLALGNAWNMAPLLAFFLLANLSSIPARLYDLATIDRLSTLETFIHVTLPQLRFTLFVFTCISVVLSLKTIDYIITVSGGGPGNASSVLAYEIYKISFLDLNLGYGAAMSFYLLALSLGLTGLLFTFWGRVEARQQ